MAEDKELPPFTLANVLGDIKDGINVILFDPRGKTIVGPIVIFLMSIISKIVISSVPYTEIDFKTYMQQIALVNEGELDYSVIQGDTGPIVYPAGFVQVYQFISWLTNGGEDILSAQALFSYLMIFTTIMAMLTYSDAPPWTVGLLLCSKRLVSIYILRLFNDCWTTFAMVGVVLVLQQLAYWHKQLGPVYTFIGSCVASDIFSLGISVKMNALLYLPGFIIVLYFLNNENMLATLGALAVIPFIQVMVGWDFLLPMFNDETAKYLRWTYITNAFKFDRKFLYEWTVNWRFVPEDIFLSDNFSNGLLLAHLSLLLAFVFTRYLSPQITGKPVSQLFKDMFKLKGTISPKNLIIDRKTGPKLILLILSTTNVVGILCCRSLHYQFLSWYCWQLPYLLSMTGWPFLVSIPVWFIHEWCWLTFPSTPISSGVLVTILALVLVSVWNNKSLWHPIISSEKKDQ